MKFTQMKKLSSGNNLKVIFLLIFKLTINYLFIIFIFYLMIFLISVIFLLEVKFIKALKRHIKEKNQKKI